ncbi:Hypothetical_protein [Hexamita inflata]|uniref:Hypothetical_protein n=1 Tax=Hexamita inflata TaxID=28002 RepID=A0AA86QCA1_9EUKA|nr:Hypothetical protein HINF_LOCUS43760 [Hexamita inflata]
MAQARQNRGRWLTSVKMDYKDVDHKLRNIIVSQDNHDKSILYRSLAARIKFRSQYIMSQQINSLTPIYSRKNKTDSKQQVVNKGQLLQTIMLNMEGPSIVIAAKLYSS